MPTRRLRHLLVSRTADFIEFPSAIFLTADPGDGEVALVVDAVEGVFAADDGIDVFLQAEIVFDG